MTSLGGQDGLVVIFSPKTGNLIKTVKTQKHYFMLRICVSISDSGCQEGERSHWRRFNVCLTAGGAEVKPLVQLSLAQPKNHPPA